MRAVTSRRMIAGHLIAMMTNLITHHKPYRLVATVCGVLCGFVLTSLCADAQNILRRLKVQNLLVESAEFSVSAGYLDDHASIMAHRFDPGHPGLNFGIRGVSIAGPYPIIDALSIGPTLRLSHEQTALRIMDTQLDIHAHDRHSSLRLGLESWSSSSKGCPGIVMTDSAKHAAIGVSTSGDDPVVRISDRTSSKQVQIPELGKRK